jgi:branched-chain amino acid transport system substrate-binding protein
MPGAKVFEKKYTKTYKRMVTWECALNYTAMYALAGAIVTAGTVDDVYKIRAAFPKALAVLPLLSDKFPTEEAGINDAGRLHIWLSVQTVTNGKSDPSVLYTWWPNTQKEFSAVKKQSKFIKNQIYWFKAK